MQLHSDVVYFDNLFVLKCHVANAINSRCGNVNNTSLVVKSLNSKHKIIFHHSYIIKSHYSHMFEFTSDMPKIVSS